jgi:ornithine decarboxylase
MVGDAGVLEAEVVLISNKSRAEERRWVYLDIGRFGGLAEVEGEGIRYRIHPARRIKGRRGPVVLAGPTCDSADILYDKADYRMPLGLKIGDRVRILTAPATPTRRSATASNP